MNFDDVKRVFEYLVNPIKNKLFLMVGRGILTAIDSQKDIQLASGTLLADENKDRIEVFQHFGFSSAIPKDSEVITLSLGGNRDHLVIIGSESRKYRVKGLNEGDTVFYNKEGKFLKLEGENLIGEVEKIQISNSENELISVLIEYFEKSRDGNNLTLVGPMPKDEATKIALTEVIEKLKTFR